MLMPYLIAFTPLSVICKLQHSFSVNFLNPVVSNIFDPVHQLMF